MSGQPENLQPDPGSSIQNKFHELSRLLRDSRHLGLEARSELSDLIEELSRVMASHALPSEETAHLAASTEHLVRSLHQQQDVGVLGAAKERLEEAALRAETEAPLATGVVRRLVDALASWGI